MFHLVFTGLNVETDLASLPVLITNTVKALFAAGPYTVFGLTVLLFFLFLLILLLTEAVLVL